MSDLRFMMWIIPCLPLAASVIIALFGPRFLRAKSHWIAIAALAGSFFYSFILLLQSPAEGVVATGYTWIETAGLTINVTLRSDQLTDLMLVTVTFVSLLVAIYSSGYMHGDPGYPRYFAVFSLFVFSMTMLVLSSNFLLLYVFWEGVGLCSYLLIGFWFQRPSAAAAARKAFLVNRIGDFGFALGIFLIWVTFGTLDYDAVFKQIVNAEHTMPLAWPLTGICLLLFMGAAGKSAQFPLHVWLPDAMEGPSPVSALIHAATMVTAGVYMVARCTPLFEHAPIAQLVVAGIGAFTALLAALIALTQNDLKRVLAYSTVSQLGYMFLALGSAAGNAKLATFAVTAAIFHLFTHAFFKALLFLGAGSVMHAMGDVIDMRRFGGLRKVLPYTHWTFLIGSLALAGIVPLAGFWSKDEILAAVSQASHGEHAIYFSILFFVALATALLTAFYTFRAYFMTFWGEEVIPLEVEGHVHETPWVMLAPLMILAACAVLVGVAFGPTGAVAGFLSKTPYLPAGEEHHAGLLIPVLGSLAAVLGGFFAWVMYVKQPDLPEKLAKSMQGIYAWSSNRFYLDEIYNVFIVKPLAIFAIICRVIDQYLVDGVVDFVGWIPSMLGRVFRPVQNGLVQFYGLAMLLGLAVFIVAMLVRWNS